MNAWIGTDTFGGMDERLDFAREPTCVRDMRNYRVTENRTLKKRCGLTECCSANGEITGLWSGYLGSEKMFLFTADGVLYRKNGNEMTEVGSVGAGKNLFFEFRRKLYIKNEHRYSVYDGTTLSEVEGYVPLIALSCTPSGGGSSFEAINMLSPKRRVRFSCDGESLRYKLPERDLLGAEVTMPEGGTVPEYTFDAENGEILFASAPESGVNNLLVCYETRYDRSEVLLHCTGVMLFGGNTDGHVFFWGNPEFIGTRFHSELANGQPSATYFPENNYTVIGDSDITDIISQYDRQIIFTKDRAYYSYCELKTDLDGDVYASFPVYNLNGEKGSLLPGAGCIMNNEPVTLCADGLNRWMSGTVENEKNAVCFSDPIGKSLRSILARGNISSMLLYNKRSSGELFFVSGSDAFVYNYRIRAWFRYDNFACSAMTEYEGILYLARGNRILFWDENASCDDGDRPVEAMLETPYLPFASAGREGKPLTLSYTLKASGQVRISLLQPKKMSISLDPSSETPVCGKIRIPCPERGKGKLIWKEKDQAFCEIAELLIGTRQKGTYGRKGF